MNYIKHEQGCEIEVNDKTVYRFKYKKGLYLIRVQPDIACRGGWNGKGTMTYINPITAGGFVEAQMRGYQGRHSKAGIIRVIKANGWDKYE